jgi:hypothetical protein
VFSGGNAMCFAYGQTGSGKTFLNLKKLLNRLWVVILARKMLIVQRESTH